MKLAQGISAAVATACLLVIVVLASMVLGDTINFGTSLKNMVPFVLIFIVALAVFITIEDKKPCQ